jgi:cytochrome b involved in lipid metabolism
MKKIFFLLLLGALAITLSACTKDLESSKVNNGAPQQNAEQQNTEQQAPVSQTPVVETPATETPAAQTPSAITVAEVALHATPADCWLAIDGRVFNINEYIKLGIHPGGDKILNGCGKDASVMFANVDKHDPKGRETLEKYVIGNLAQ